MIWKNKMPTTKIAELFEFDKSNLDNHKHIIGTDEAGRGPGAGPVVAAAICFHKGIDNEILETLQVLNDSKKLTEKKREELFENILILEKQGKCLYSISFGSVEEIEKFNILNTSLNCMKKSCLEVIKKLNNEPTNTLVDGNKLIKNFPHPQKYIIKGDAKSASIAAASILAKVSRDKFMNELAQEYPNYDWGKNKGYLSSTHINAIKEFGPTKWHRKKFLRNILEENNKPEEQLSLFNV